MSVWNPEAMLDPHKRQSKSSRLADVTAKKDLHVARNYYAHATRWRGLHVHGTGG
jgi:hypothetical protein